MDKFAMSSQPSPEIYFSPLDRFNLLQHRFEHIVESRSDDVEGISIEIPADHENPVSWIRLGIYLEQLRGLSTETADVHLRVRWGSTKDAADMADLGISRSTLENNSHLDRHEEVIRILEIAVNEAEDAIFILK